MNTIIATRPAAVATPRRAASALISSLLFGVTAAAQVPPGDIAVLVADGSSVDIYIAPGSGGVPFLVGGSASIDLDKVTRIAIDPVSPFVDPGSGLTTRGHLVVSTADAGSNQLWQLYLSGSTIVADRKLADLPSGTLTGLHRSSSGCYLALVSNAGSSTLSRVTVVGNAASVYTQTLTGLTGGSLRGVTTGPDGNAYVAERFNVTGGMLPPSRLTRVTSGGALQTVGSVSFEALALAFSGTTPSASLAAGGLASTIVTTNFACGGTETTFGPGLFPGIWPLIRDVELDAATGTFLLAIGGGALPNSELRRVDATGCTLANPTTVFVAAGGFVVVDAAVSTSEIGYGCEAPTANGLYPVIGQVAPPRIGNNWLPTLARGTPSTSATLYLGFDTTSYLGLPLPLDVSAFGGQPGATFMTSGTSSFPTATDAVGNALVSIAVPNNPALIAVRVYAQWSIVDPLLPYSLPVAFSAGLSPAIQ